MHTYIVYFDGNPLYAFKTQAEARDYINKCILRLTDELETYQRKVRGMYVLAVPYWE